TAGPRARASPSPASASAAPNTRASDTPTRPEATGRVRLRGWLRSAAASRLSLRQYTAPDTSTNASAASTPSPTLTPSAHRPENTSGERTNRFFVHCFGRVRARYAPARDQTARPRPGRGGVARSAGGGLCVGLFIGVQRGVNPAAAPNKVDDG